MTIKSKIKFINLTLIGTILMPFATILIGITPKTFAQAQSSIAPVLQNILPQLRQETRLPILLPNSLPQTTEQLYIGGSVAEDYYMVEVGYTPKCYGMACMAGSFSASLENYGLDGNPITLKNGIKGYFQDPTCPMCSDTSLSWRQNGVVYTFRYKVPGQTTKQRLEAMLQMANSAIEAGPRDISHLPTSSNRAIDDFEAISSVITQKSRKI